MHCKVPSVFSFRSNNKQKLGRAKEAINVSNI